MQMSYQKWPRNYFKYAEHYIADGLEIQKHPEM